MSFSCRSCGVIVNDTACVDFCRACRTQRDQHEQLLDSQINPRDLFAAHIAGSFTLAMMQDEDSRKKLEDPENMKKLPELISAYSFAIADAMMKERDR